MNTITRITTPAGIAKYCFINEPQKTFNPDGTYNVQLVLSADASEDLRGKLDALLEEAKAYGQEQATPQRKGSIATNQPYLEEYDEEGIKTGNYEFRFKLNAMTKDRQGNPKARKPIIVDSQKNPMTQEVGSGSKMKVAFNAKPYYVAGSNCQGVSLFLSAVQILELVEYSGVGNDFDEESEGFVSEVKAKSNQTDDDFDC